MENNRELHLIQLVKDGDRSAMSDLYRHSIGYLTALCSRYLTDADEVRDTLQNSFMKIFSSMDKFQYRGQGSLRAWMSRIVVNESLKTLAAHKKNTKFKEELQVGTIDLNEEEPDIEDIPAAAIQEMIRDLPEGYRTVFNLFVFEEMSHKEIAGILGITESTSASQFHRAKNILAKKIREYRNRELS